MANFSSWSTNVLRRSIGVFINSTLGALVGISVADAAEWVNIGQTGWSISEPNLYVAALMTGFAAALTRTLVPAIQEIGSKLSATPKKELDL